MTVEIVELTMTHYDEMIALMEKTPGIGLSDADRPEAIAGYLLRNPGLSLAAFDRQASVEIMAGCLLCGHDGRRGFLHHMVVAPAYRQRGLGRQMAGRALAALAGQGIDKVHLFVKTANQPGQAFWEKIGWQQRDDILMYSHYTSIGEA